MKIFKSPNIIFNFKFLFNTPTSYAEDGLFNLSTIMNFTDNFPLYFTDRLNYPYGSNLTDGYLISDKFLQILQFLFIKMSNLYASTFLISLFTHIIAGLTMFYVCRLIEIKRLFSFLAALTFGLSNFIFARGYNHLTVGFVFIIPLIVLCLSNLLNNSKNVISVDIFFVINIDLIKCLIF